MDKQYFCKTCGKEISAFENQFKNGRCFNCAEKSYYDRVAEELQSDEEAKRKAAEARKVAVKEFAEKMKEICVKKRQFIDLDDNGEEEYYFDGAVTIDEIDKLLKEYEK